MRKCTLTGTTKAHDTSNTMSSKGSDKSRLDCKVYVGDLGYGAVKQELEDLFSRYGPLRNVWVARNPPGFAFVEFEDPRDADDSCRGLDGTRARVELSSGKSRWGRDGPPTRRGRGGSYRSSGWRRGAGGSSGRRRSRTPSPRRRSPSPRRHSRSRTQNLPTTEDLDHQITTDDNKYCVFKQIYHEEEEGVKLKKIEMILNHL
ncbi:hypothetical protein KUTeg_022877 [Tegillarca granosa]|uniref:RRM domain-containing protein n=1 Tax=Tegillarca granosa TaxID=220873 RepID=A0ABQ9E4M4_TEGGR|nr:hypothetical protein KUTeg_022877 [Tegillarca granosa]